MKRRYQIGALCILALSAYYPAVLAGVGKVDDQQMVESLTHATSFDLRSLFFPAIGGGSYYRPILTASFIIDKYLLGLSPGLMHLENVLLHCLNAILVYFVTLHVLPLHDRKRALVPFAAASIFALHPIATESVNWISGRTDVLAGTFVLASAFLLVRFRESSKGSHIVLALVAFLAAILAKETSLAFLPGFLLLIRPDQPAAEYPAQRLGAGNNAQLSLYAMVALSALCVVVLFFFLRSHAFTSNSSRIGITLRYIADDWVHTFMVVIRAFGFYMKKVFMPYPLNFAIMEVDPLYDLLAVPLIVGSAVVVFRRQPYSVFYATGVGLIFPAFILIFNQIAWTPYAERYAYIASAFLVISAALYIRGRTLPRHSGALKVAVSLLLLVMFGMTLHRSIVWRNDYRLVKDTVEKSPWSRAMRGVYASLLAERGDFDEAIVQAQRGRSLPYVGDYDDNFDMVLAFIAGKQGKVDESIALYEDVLHKKGGRPQVVLQNLVLLYEMKLAASRDVREKKALEKRITAYTMALYDLTRDPQILYRMGADAMTKRQYASAIRYFREARERMASDDPYRAFAAKHIERLLKMNTGDHVQDR